MTSALEFCIETFQVGAQSTFGGAFHVGAQSTFGGAFHVGRFNCRAQSEEKNRTACLRLLLSVGASVKHFKMNARMWPTMSEDSVLVLYAAGLEDFENQPMNVKNFTDKGLDVPEIFKHLDRKYNAKRKTVSNFCDITCVPTLYEICRDMLRDELIKQNATNLFQVVSKLPLPNEVKAYLLYGASLNVQENALLQNQEGHFGAETK